MLYTWKMKIDSKKQRRNSLRPINPRKLSICMSTSRTGTLLYRWPDNTTQKA